ncbi:hypothetical protein SDC9_101711 [bioreactor metagenome]|uniref:Uncharacterized protein n=1 Tax=bioreactor metagenome TaxID=1076179 RepID=A0A645AQ87_9ZZZZ
MRNAALTCSFLIPDMKKNTRDQSGVPAFVAFKFLISKNFWQSLSNSCSITALVSGE